MLAARATQIYPLEVDDTRYASIAQAVVLHLNPIDERSWDAASRFFLTSVDCVYHTTDDVSCDRLDRLLFGCVLGVEFYLH